MKIDSIIFDLDGTLWDSTESVVKAMNSVLKNFKEVKETITVEKFKSVTGMQIKDMASKLFHFKDEEKQMEIMKESCKIQKEMLLKEGGKLYPKVEPVLAKLSKEYPLFIVSNGFSGYIQTFLQYHNLGKYFKDTECSGDTGLSKGENIKSVIKRNNLKNPIYVGDTEGDSNHVKQVGIPFVFAAYGFGKVDNYDYRIEELAELAPLIESIIC